jgi:hypothetical protein
MELRNQLPTSHPLTAPDPPPERVTGPPELHHSKGRYQHVRDRWSIENSWHWPRDTQLREDAHRYREENGVQIMATLRSMAMNALRLDGFWSIAEGLAALSHDITGLLRLLGWQEPLQPLASG